jgi:hypothetical protein
MTEEFRTQPNGYGAAFGKEQPANQNNQDSGEVGKALLVGLLGGLVSAAGYMIYRRLPDEQKERLHVQVRGMVSDKVNELRQNFNI